MYFIYLLLDTRCLVVNGGDWMTKNTLEPAAPSLVSLQSAVTLAWNIKTLPLIPNSSNHLSFVYLFIGSVPILPKFIGRTPTYNLWISVNTWQEPGIFSNFCQLFYPPFPTPLAITSTILQACHLFLARIRNSFRTCMGWTDCLSNCHYMLNFLLHTTGSILGW